jgi:hypothetical protein
MASPPPPTSGSSGGDFNRVLTRYKDNLTTYKVTGNSALKTAVDTDKAWLDSYVQGLSQKTVQQQSAIQAFVANYQNTNPELVKLHQQLKKVREEGPKIQDIYQTEVEASKEEPIDFTSYYVKGGLIIGVGVAVALLGVFRPTYTI